MVDAKATRTTTTAEVAPPNHQVLATELREILMVRGKSPVSPSTTSMHDMGAHYEEQATHAQYSVGYHPGGDGHGNQKQPRGM